jgi:hypothetical protein
MVEASNKAEQKSMAKRFRNVPPGTTYVLTGHSKIRRKLKCADLEYFEDV